MFMEETIGDRINTKRAEHILDYGAATVAAACPFCTTMLKDGPMDKQSAIVVKDIAELLMAAEGSGQLSKHGRSITYLDGIRLNI
jgi:Fe-S oxidoreductase